MKANPWEKIEITLPFGQTVQAVAPVIISASRSTDIPAFHAEWFMRRLRAGYAVWRNPFNQREQYVSFAKARVVVFWSKNPAPLLPYLDEIERMGLNYYFQFTINDYEAEGWEPRVPKLAQRVRTFVSLAERIGPERVIWRFDPLLLSETLDEVGLVEKIGRVGDVLHPFTRKLVFSFADISAYRKVRTNLTSAGISYREFDPKSMRVMAQKIAEVNEPWGLELATCSESEDFLEFGIAHNRCIDGDLMQRLFRDDKKLQSFLNPGCATPRMRMPGLPSTWQDSFKDHGQRKECGCIVSKDIGSYNTCGHLCTYCYANVSENVVRRNLRDKDADRESIA